MLNLIKIEAALDSLNRQLEQFHGKVQPDDIVIVIKTVTSNYQDIQDLVTAEANVKIHLHAQSDDKDRPYK